MDNDCLRIDVIDNVVNKVFQNNKKDLLQNVSMSSLYFHVEEEEVLDFVMRLEGKGYLPRNRFEELREEKAKPIPLIDQALRLDLKQLPSSL